MLSETSTAELSEETVFEVLSNRRRRYVFHYLKRAGREVYLRELADRVAAWEYDKPMGQLGADERKNLKTALHQHHLPKMDAHGFVRYDRGRGTVELSEAAADLEVYLDVVPVADIAWSNYYLGLALVGLGTLATVWWDLGPTGIVTEEAVGVFFTVALFVSAGVHSYLNRTRLRLGGTEQPPEVDRS